ncbi:hypothetical protein VQ7734_03586 [Vibrio quintilis]|uniref:tRNA(Glu)-specific nuclease WapA n=1 Tax=Vibrio quintilis TaxID=1117707 RepID=A0A1M7YZF1_9VIBR|nr:RHS repeat-associated core domain-containing protein [Vibrio quintilis]SHO57816.1 hypothetical protein VQ7734_03586 [Vibrio quintilis]
MWVYDQDLGRFISADPDIQAPFVTNSFNRYAYVWNNPLKYTDPTGFWTAEETDVTTGEANQFEVNDDFASPQTVGDDNSSHHSHSNDNDSHSGDSHDKSPSSGSFGEGIFSRIQQWGDEFDETIKGWSNYIPVSVKAGMTIAGGFYHSGGGHISESLSAQHLEVNQDIVDVAYAAASGVAAVARSKSFKGVKP